MTYLTAATLAGLKSLVHSLSIAAETNPRLLDKPITITIDDMEFEREVSRSVFATVDGRRHGLRMRVPKEGIADSFYPPS